MTVNAETGDMGQDTDHFRLLILKKFDEMSKEQASTNKLLEKLTTAFVGDPGLGTTGVIRRLADVETQSKANGEAIAAESTRVNIRLAYLGGIGTAVGTAAGFLVEWLTSKR